MLDTESRHSTTGGLDQGPSRDPWLTMDCYLGTDSVSLQEMLDLDIKSEVGEHNGMGFNFTDWSPLELEDNHVDSQDDLNKWLTNTSFLNGNSNSSSSNFNLDLSGGDAHTVMVNPNSVMPLLTSRLAGASPPAPVANNKRHFSFTRANNDDDDDEDDDEDEDNDDEEEGEENSEEGDDKDVHMIDDETEVEEPDTETEEQYENEVSDSGEEDEDVEDEEEESEDELAKPRKATSSSVVLPNCAIKTLSPQITKAQHAMSKVGQTLMPSLRVQNVKLLTPSQAHHHHVRKQQMYNNNLHVGQTPSPMGGGILKRDKDYDLSDYDDKSYPKPAYSYSCLIAMALKNSLTGSLPVSEIYNFMCEHFPYFKTAPNGWKNSVRHNLSLNKCFEKIEKPAGNGNQRKGCLWAINPAKIAKMDEEVQKWSRKDPLAIKKAMIYPEQLELLERGEMKYSALRNGDLSDQDSESSGDETAEESIGAGVAYDPPSHHSHVAANSVTDSFDESSQDIDITEHIYEDSEIVDNKDSLRMQLDISQPTEQDEDDEDDEGTTTTESFQYELGPSTKRQKTIASTLQGNYVYQQMTPSRRKAPLLLRPGATTGSPFLKID